MFNFRPISEMRFVKLRGGIFFYIPLFSVFFLRLPFHPFHLLLPSHPFPFSSFPFSLGFDFCHHLFVCLFVLRQDLTAAQASKEFTM